jgi:4-hydroxy-tetrahydrodipicolinate reductase
MSIKVCVAGATGWAGSELSRGIAGADDLALVAAMARRHAGQVLGEVLDEPRLTAPIFASVDEALAQPCDVLVEYTGADSAKANILAALKHGLHVVVGSSGLSDNDYAQIDAVARERGRGVLACGNFALTAVLLIKFAEMAAKIIPQWELIDYASAGKPDAPSGTVANWPAGWARCVSRNCGCQSARPSACRKRAVARWPAARCMPCACQDSCLAPRRFSACRTRH